MSKSPIVNIAKNIGRSVCINLDYLNQKIREIRILDRYNSWNYKLINHFNKYIKEYATLGIGISIGIIFLSNYIINIRK